MDLQELEIQYRELTYFDVGHQQEVEALVAKIEDNQLYHDMLVNHIPEEQHEDLDKDFLAVYDLTQKELGVRLDFMQTSGVIEHNWATYWNALTEVLDVSDIEAHLELLKIQRKILGAMEEDKWKTVHSTYAENWQAYVDFKTGGSLDA